MKNLIIDAGNYTNIGGKQYNSDDMACNYPISQTFNDIIDVTTGSTLITTSGDFTLLLGGDLQNTNVPVLKWLVTSGDGGIVLEISHLLSATRAILKVPCVATTGAYSFQSVDFYGQPVVEQTFGIDSTNGFVQTAPFYTKYGASNVVVGGSPVAMGLEPLLINMSTAWAQMALNIQYL